MTDVAATEPWYEAYPKPRNAEPNSIDRQELLRRMKAEQAPGIDFLLVDLRRTDHEGGTIRGSLNLPAQSLYDTIPTLYALCKAAKIETVIWYCGKSVPGSGSETAAAVMRVFGLCDAGSSRGRGKRAAGWFSDFVMDQDDVHMESVILSDGIKGWVAAGKEYQDCMVGFDLKCWQKTDPT